jgi:hypothetical protein
MKISPDEILMSIPLAQFEALNIDLRNALKASSSRDPWTERGARCFVVDKDDRANLEQLVALSQDRHMERPRA